MIVGCWVFIAVSPWLRHECGLLLETRRLGAQAQAKTLPSQFYVRQLTWIRR